MRIALVVVATSTLLASAGHAQEAPSHFTYTGLLRVEGTVVAEAERVPLRRVRFVEGGLVDVSLRHEGLRFVARGDRSGLQYHVHAWTRARARGFEVYVAPETVGRVAEGSTERSVILADGELGEVTLRRPHALPAWLRAHIAAAAHLSTRCEAVTLYPRPSDAGEPLAIDAGQALYARPARGDWQETWVRLDTQWVRGYTRGARCETEEISGLGSGGPGISLGMEPTHVVLPRGLHLVSPAHPARVVMRVRAPVEASSWAPGWTSTNDEGALMIAFPCGTWIGHLTIASSQLVPEGAPPHAR